MTDTTRYLDSLTPEALFLIKCEPCPHCRKFGNLVGHGNLTGPAADGSSDQIRGKRLLCSNRGLKKLGCGKTLSALSSDKIKRHRVSTALLWSFLSLILDGLSLMGAWNKAVTLTRSRFCDSLCYKLWPKFLLSQSSLRSQLCTLEVPAPDTPHLSRHPRDPCAAQALEHLRLAFPKCGDPISVFQFRFQSGVFS